MSRQETNVAHTEYRRETKTTSDKTYAKATTSIQFPKKDQCIILPYTKNIRIQEYVFSLSDLIKPKDILFCLRMSRDRIGIYLSSKEIVDDFLQKHGLITTFNHKIPARRYVNHDKRIIISNAPPHLPHNVIEELIQQYDVNLSSNINFLRLGVQDDRLTHVLSFRRQAYINAESIEKIPPTAVLNFEGEQYCIFFNDDQLRCFHCKEIGHASISCPTNILPDEGKQTNPDETKENEETVITETIDQTPEIQTNDGKQTNSSNEMEVTQQVFKRPLSAITESTNDQSITPKNSSKIDEETKQLSQPIKKKEKTKNKKIKTDTPTEDKSTSIVEQLKPIEENYKQNLDKYPISLPNFRILMDMVKGYPDPISIIMQLTNDIKGVAQILEDNYHLLNRSMKTRFTKLKKKIEIYLRSDQDINQHPPDNETEEDSDFDSENSTTSE